MDKRRKNCLFVFLSLLIQQRFVNTSYVPFVSLSAGNTSMNKTALIKLIL